MNQILARPNTSIHYTLFTPHTLPMLQQVLKREGWERRTSQYPDQSIVNGILGICEYGARIGYEDSRTSISIHLNLSSAEEDPNMVTGEMVSELKKTRLELYPDYRSLPNHYTASPC